MYVLGIESSCDETAVGLYGGTPPGLQHHLLSSQAELHAEYGGVVPELAARDHQARLLPLVAALLGQSGRAGTELAAIACTAGPGLIGALKTGLSLASGLAVGWQLPLLHIHHMEAHLLAVLLERPVAFPWLTLLISGGHTQLVRADGLGQYTLLGSSRDDAVGEAFDKVAKLLNLPYPGGPELELLAADGDCARFDLPRPMAKSADCDFSFSGLKTAVFYALRAELPGYQPGADISPDLAADMAASFQRAVADTLAAKVRRALRQTGLKQLVVGGGVAANATVRAALTEVGMEAGAEVIFPSPALCTDNGAMVALVGWHRLAGGERGTLQLTPQPRWSLETLTPPAGMMRV